ncbi:MAG: hypothetical protein MZV70_36275 [Desulfobacterales bacterium]|nr:hypothetical protein [Desulfobacterales bacterium]
MKFWRMLALVLIGVVVIGAVIFVAWCGHYKAEAGRNWQNYLIQQGITETNADLYRQEKVQWEEQMAELRGMVDSAALIIAESEEARAESEAELEGLETLRPLLSDKDAIIKNLDEQIVVYKKMVSEFKLTIEQKDVQIFSLTKQVHETGRILQASEAQTLAERELRLAAERGWSLEKSRYKPFIDKEECLAL